MRSFYILYYVSPADFEAYVQLPLDEDVRTAGSINSAFILLGLHWQEPKINTRVSLIFQIMTSADRLVICTHRT